MVQAIKALVMALAVIVLSGCATSLDPTATTVDWSKGSVVAMTVELTNEYKPEYQPSHMGVVVMKTAGTNANQRISGLGRIYAGKNTFLVTQQLMPGQYNLMSITGISHKLPVIGNIDFSVHAPFEVTANSVIYLGRISTVNKQRVNKDDQTTGGVIPIIDQIASGFGAGTLQVALKDNYEEDVEILKKNFVAVRNLPVVRSPLQNMRLERAMGSSAPHTEVKLSATAATTPQVPTSTSR